MAQTARIETVDTDTGKLHRLWIDGRLVNIYRNKARANKLADRVNSGEISLAF